MDPLSDVLSLLDARSSMFAGLRAGGDWAIQFPPPDGIKFNAVVEGECWLGVDGGDPLHLATGDCFLLTERRPFALGSDLALPRAQAGDVYRVTRNGIAQHGTATDLFLIGGRFDFRDEARLLLDGLPDVVVVRGGSPPAATLLWALRRLAHEFSSGAPGASLMTRHLGQMMLVEVLRLYLAGRQDPPAGWLFALTDPRLHAALSAIHADPARRWTVQELAQMAALSRSTFALHFKQKVGRSPLEYLLHWRMQIAARELRTRSTSVSSIGQALGYDSDSAFSNAFKRVMACSPTEYRNQDAKKPAV